MTMDFRKRRNRCYSNIIVEAVCWIVIIAMVQMRQTRPDTFGDGLFNSLHPNPQKICNIALVMR